MSLYMYVCTKLQLSDTHSAEIWKPVKKFI